MTKEMKPGGQTQEAIDPSKIKQKYAEMNKQANQAPQLSEAEINERRKLEEEKLDAVLPYLRKQAEATRLEMDLTEMDCKMGRVNPQQIPGMLGKRLQIEAMNDQQTWARLMMAQNEMIQKATEEKAKLEELQKSEADKQSKATTDTIVKD